MSPEIDTTAAITAPPSQADMGPFSDPFTGTAADAKEVFDEYLAGLTEEDEVAPIVPGVSDDGPFASEEVPFPPKSKFPGSAGSPGSGPAARRKGV